MVYHIWLICRPAPNRCSAALRRLLAISIESLIEARSPRREHILNQHAISSANDW
jgi:hypothetical protein